MNKVQQFSNVKVFWQHPNSELNKQNFAGWTGTKFDS